MGEKERQQKGKKNDVVYKREVELSTGGRAPLGGGEKPGCPPCGFGGCRFMCKGLSIPLPCGAGWCAGRGASPNSGEGEAGCGTEAETGPARGGAGKEKAVAGEVAEGSCGWEAVVGSWAAGGVRSGEC